MNEIATTEAPAVNPLQALLSDPQQLKELDVDKLERLFAVHSRSLFYEAFNKVQGEMTPVFKAGKSHTNAYARAEDVIGMLSPLLQKHGFGWGVSARPSEKGVEYSQYVLTLRHTGGHIEEHTLDAPIDYIEGNRAKTKIQAMASSYTFCERHLLLKVFGVQLTDDNDGNLASLEKISKNETMDLAKLITEAKANKELFLKHFRISKLSDLPASRFKQAKTMLESKLNG